MLEQLHQRQLRHAAQLLQIARIKRLDEYGRTCFRVLITLQGIEERQFLRQSNGGEMRRVLGFRIHADGPIAAWLSICRFCGRNCGSRSRARSVFISDSVKSSVNQPVKDSPSMT